MSLLCLCGRHAARPSNISNQGYYFSRCTRCGREMIGSAVKWKPVPRGKRIVWRPVHRGAASRPKPVYNLPMVIPQRIAKPRRLRPRFSFAKVVAADLCLFAWSGANGIRQWQSNLLGHLARQRSRPRELPVIRMPYRGW
ncbi:MAG: ftsZ [Alphaproteobacteria bacterium]|nr:ftsZ [Alphaproteobacteria bacterium]